MFIKTDVLSSKVDFIPFCRGVNKYLRHSRTHASVRSGASRASTVPPQGSLIGRNQRDRPCRLGQGRPAVQGIDRRIRQHDRTRPVSRPATQVVHRLQHIHRVGVLGMAIGQGMRPLDPYACLALKGDTVPANGLGIGTQQIDFAPDAGCQRVAERQCGTAGARRSDRSADRSAPAPIPGPR